MLRQVIIYTPKRLAKIRVVVFVNQQARDARPISPQQVLSLVNTRSLWGRGMSTGFRIIALKKKKEKEKRTCKIVDFAILADLGVKLKENEREA